MNRAALLAVLFATQALADDRDLPGAADPNAPRVERTVPVDAGDRYPSPWGESALLRKPGQWVITFREGLDPFERLEAARSEAKLMRDDFAERKLYRRMMLVEERGKGRPMAALRRALERAGDVVAINPYFIDPASGLGNAVTDELIVRLKPGVDAKDYFGAEMARARPLFLKGPEYVLALTNADHAFVLAEVARHAADPRIEWAQPNMVSEMKKLYQPNDLLFAEQWHHDHIGQNGAKTNEDIRTPQAWDMVRGGSNTIVIAIMDDGVEWTHPDLAANTFTNTGDNDNDGVDDDGNGVADDAIGYDFLLGTNISLPQTTNDNHGTACAGMAAAVGNNNLGVAGSAFRARILPVTVLGGVLPFASRAQAIRYAAGLDGAGNQVWRGADILSLSWTGTRDASGDSALTAAITAGRNGRGCPVFAATGNDASGYSLFNMRFLTNFPAGPYMLRFEYYKDAAASNGFDAAWIGHVRLPDADHTYVTFDSLDLPDGWTVGGNAPFAIEDDPQFAYGLGRYQARSGAILDGQTSWIQTPQFNLDLTNTGSFSLWVDTEAGVQPWTYPPFANEGDWVFVRVFNVNSGTWSTVAYDAGVPGNRRNVNGNPVSTNSWPAGQTNVIGVGGVTDMGYRYDGSEFLAAGLQFVAPTAGGKEGVWTTDRVSTNGYDATAGTNGNYTSFSGTSAATPLAAGVAALILSANTNLTFIQLRQRMRVSCDQIGDVTYTGVGTNLYYGYGRVNAYRALLSNSIPASVTISNDTVRNTREYYPIATQTVRHAYTVEAGGDVTMSTTTRIVIGEGFSARTGSAFRATSGP